MYALAQTNQLLRALTLFAGFWRWNDWILPGTTETTCNLWSVYLFEEVLNISRDTAHPALEPAQRAERIQEYINSGREFDQWSVWTALETYLQLQEAFGWGLYSNIFAQYRMDADSPQDDQEKIDLWVSRTSIESGFNLVPFYLAWGFPISATVQQELSQLPEWLDNPMQ